MQACWHGEILKFRMVANKFYTLVFAVIFHNRLSVFGAEQQKKNKIVHKGK